MDGTGDGGGALTAARLACGSCGTELPPKAKFCNECGAPVRAAAMSAEYKQVTVLFADVVGSMDIAATVGAERLREIMAELFGRGAAVVKRYGGTMEKFTGDGLMALFGAPVALEDHAFRACLAALRIQTEAGRVADEAQARDGISLRLRVGLNSGQVVAGEIGSDISGYAAIGEQVGLAQRMESVAPPGGVMLSESTARLVEHAAVLADTELVKIKGKDTPVPARRLLGMEPGRAAIGRTEASLVGRRWEMAALEALVDRTIGGNGGVVKVVGPPGIGKSRVAREAAVLAGARGADVHWTYCESHARDIPFDVVTRLLRTASGVADLDDQAARARAHDQVPDADPQDLLLLDDLLGIADPYVPLPQIDPDARRRRLTALLNSVTLARTEPVLYVIEDTHWIDEVSESMVADLLTVIPRTPSMVLITYRPEYDGALTRVHGGQTIALAPLGDSDAAALIGELLGSDPSVGELAAIIAERAAGNPFFAEEMVRELAQRGVLTGQRGGYVCHTNAADVAVPATVQAAIAARIDRLSAPAKRTLNAASVIGAPFSAELLTALDIHPEFDEPLAAELIDQVSFTPRAEYAFRHPLIRAVAYESQLKSDRAELHRRLAAEIQERAPDWLEENAALIAEHLEAAGELQAAYGWHMRAAAWSTNRDIAAARLSWERARQIADALPDDHPARLSMRIAPRTMLCATDQIASQESRGRFAELRELCSAAGDKVSLAIGMTGLITELLYAGRSREGSRLASEQMALLESIGDPSLTLGLAFVALGTWFDAGEFGELSRWSQTVVDLAAGDPAKGAGFGIGSPLAIGLALRGIARWWLGRPGWQQDLHEALAMARNSDPTTFALLVGWTYGVAIGYGVLGADESAVCASEEAVQTARRAGNDYAVMLAEYGLGVALLYRDAAGRRHRGLEIMAQIREWQHERAAYMVPITELLALPERARRGDRDAAIAVVRIVVDDLQQAGRLGFGVFGIGVLVEMLLERGAEADLAEAQEAIDRLANVRADEHWAVRDIWLLRLHAMLAAAVGDEAAYRDYRDRYRAMATSLGFTGHMKWAEAMP